MAKLCSDCGARRVMGGSKGSPEEALCEPCMEYAGWENHHSDEDHEANPDPKCPVCVGPKPGEVQFAHSSGVPQSHTSHAGCDHPSSKSARAACRRKRSQ